MCRPWIETTTEYDPGERTRSVRVDAIRVLEFAPPYYTLELEVGSGFYVRSLVRDIGEHFACGSTLMHLVRTKQGGFELDAIMEEPNEQDTSTSDPAASTEAQSPRVREQYVIGVEASQIRNPRSHSRSDATTESDTEANSSQQLADETSLSAGSDANPAAAQAADSVPTTAAETSTTFVTATPNDAEPTSPTIPPAILEKAATYSYVPRRPFLPCTREDILRVLDVPLEQRRGPSRTHILPPKPETESGDSGYARRPQSQARKPYRFHETFESRDALDQREPTERRPRERRRWNDSHGPRENRGGNWQRGDRNRKQEWQRRERSGDSSYQREQGRERTHDRERSSAMDTSRQMD